MNIRNNISFKLEGYLLGIKFKKTSKWPWMEGKRESFSHYLIERLKQKQTMFKTSTESEEVFEVLSQHAKQFDFGLFGLMISVSCKDIKTGENRYSLPFPHWWNYLGRFIYICPRSRRQNRIATLKLFEYFSSGALDKAPELEYEAPPNIECQSMIYNISYYESQTIYFKMIGSTYLSLNLKRTP
eukprot:TRINITY_DN919_c0_g1_i1.p1 TRINITY_DN919_c0_g1~~TRINITY_DN919_c0_g1_i1.p1  ORF type:complete len:202 (-),score=26.11 TRINITY_DN919_c0_g1_i1:465-1019(-)